MRRSSPNGFQRFPSSLVLLIAVRSLLAQDPEFQGLLETVVWPQPGETFLGFELVREIGRGTFGRVFLASEPALGGRQVVLKVAPRGGREAEVLGRLRHPNIVPVHSVQVDQTTGLTAFCMPYLGCATLGDVLDRGFAATAPPQSAHIVLEAVRAANADLVLPASALPHRHLRRGPYVNSAIHLAAELADALAYAHEQGVYHRDLKPSNVLLSPDGRPLLLDFNLSADERLSGVEDRRDLAVHGPRGTRQTGVARAGVRGPFLRSAVGRFLAGRDRLSTACRLAAV